LFATPSEAGTLRQSFGGANPHQTIHAAGGPSNYVYMLCYGWAFRIAQLGDGRRQILSVLLAGDLFSSRMIFSESAEYSFQALTHVRFARFDRSDLRAAMIANIKLFDAFAQVCANESKAADELVIDLGRRNAEERIARLILHLTDRIGERTVVRDSSYPFPLRQNDMADILGLTSVHVSRVITKFRKAGLIEYAGGNLRIMRPQELAELSRPTRNAGSTA
jgi:CRP-like cAMP-binding protein